MNLDGFLRQFISTSNDEKPNIVSMEKPCGGKWLVPEDKMEQFYKKLVKYIIKKNTNCLLVEKMQEIHPLVLDIDIKYTDKITDHQYTEETISKIVTFIRLNLSDLLHLDDDNRLNEVWVMEKDKPYPCQVIKYASKDGIHIALPNIIIKKSTYRKIVSILKDQGVIESIFNETCEIKPSNDDLLDGCFSGWQPNGCSKKNEEPYKLTHVYQLDDNYQLQKVDDEIFEESYTNPLKILKKLSMIVS